MQLGIDIRPARPEDAHAACALLRRSITEGCAADWQGNAAILDAWLGNKTPDNVAAWFSAATNYAMLAVRDDAVLGLALLNQAGKLALCYVQPEAVRTGVGSALITALEQQARSWCISKVFLHSPPSASGFFTRLGYANAGRERSCFGLDCDFFWKSLEVDAACALGARKRFCTCSGN